MSVAIGLFCKTPTPGSSKTRLSPPLQPQECSALSACFIRDLSANVAAACAETDAAAYAIYTPVGSEPKLRTLLPTSFRLLPQREDEFGRRLLQSIAELLATGEHDGAILLNADSPTLPISILKRAIEATRGYEGVVLGPALDGGYTLIGMARPHAHLFENIPWSTAGVYGTTLARAREIGVPVCELDPWYDVDDRETLELLEAELAGRPLPFARHGVSGAHAPATAQFISARRGEPAPHALAGVV